MSRRHSIPIRSRVLARLGAASAAMEPFKWPNTYRSTAVNHYDRVRVRDAAEAAAQTAAKPTLERN